MSELDSAIQAAAQRYNIPAPILYGVAMTESGGNPNVGNSRIAPAIGNDSHRGAFQISGDMAAKYGGNPDDLASSAMMAARALRENTDHFGNLDDGVKGFHGGWDKANWRDRTNANYASVVSHANQYADQQVGGNAPAPQSAPDPIEAALAGNAAQGQTTQQSTSDPIEDALSGKTDGVHTASGIGNLGLDSPRRGDSRGNDAIVRVPGQTGSPGSPTESPRTWGQWAAGLDPATDAAFNGGSYLKGIQNRGAGILSGIASVPQFLLNEAGNVVSAVGNPKAGATLNRWADGLREFAGSGADDPNAGTFKTGELAGMVGATLPVSGINVLRAGEGAGRLATGLLRYGNMSVQGAAGGAAASGGHDVLNNAAAGAILAPVVGAGIDKFIAPAAGKGMALAKGLINFVAPPGPAVTVAADSAAPIAGAARDQAEATIAGMFKSGASADEIRAYAGPKGIQLPDIDKAVAARGSNKIAPLINRADIPAPVTPAEAQTAMGSRGQNTGIASNPGLTPDVQARATELRGQGVPVDQAMRQASIESVGAKPMTAQVTRDPVLQRQVNEGAKLNTDQGQAINDQVAGNNAAVIKAANDTVQNYGGAPGPGAALQKSAESLAAASDAERKGVTALYNKAEQTDGAALGPTDGLRAVVSDPRNLATATTEGGAFIKGIAAKLKVLDPKGRGLNPQDLETLRKAANQAIGPTSSGEVRMLAGKVKDAIDGSFDELGNAGEGYKAARAAHKAWVEKYDNPKGIAKLIKRDPQGSFANADSWAAQDRILNSTDDASAIQIIRQLKANGDTASIDALKAHLVQGAFDNASKGAIDQLGNATLSGKMFRSQLDKAGKAKLDALFTPEEQAHLANIGNAASHLNEAVPNTFNASGTDSAGANRLSKAIINYRKGGAPASAASKVIGASLTGVGAAVGHFGGFGAIEGGAGGMGLGAIKSGVDAVLQSRASSKANAALIEAMRGASSPDISRAADTEAARKQVVDALRRVRANVAAGRSGAVGATHRKEGERP